MQHNNIAIEKLKRIVMQGMFETF